MKITIILYALVFNTCFVLAQNNPNTLVYKQPAGNFQQGLPLGNGRLGAMVFGDVTQEKIMLNEDSFWSGEPVDVTIPGAQEIVLQIQKAIEKGDHRLADQLAQKIQGPYNQSYQPLEALFLTFNHNGQASNYSRKLDLRNAVAKVSYKVNDVTYTRTAFTSFPDQILVVHLEADKPSQLNFEVKLEGPHQRSAQVERNKNLKTGGKAPANVDPSYLNTTKPVIYDNKQKGKGMNYTTLLKLDKVGGNITSKGNALIVKNATEVTLYLAARTSFNGYDKSPSENGLDNESLANTDLENLRGKSYDQIYQRHVKDFSPIFDRVSLQIAGRPAVKSVNSSENLFSEMDLAKKTEMIFQLGRYMTISGSRAGSQPLNLQGIWNSEVRPPWSSNYTMNINSQMNYWPVMVANLAECHEPMLKFIEELAVNGRKTAKVNYGANGWVAHHNADLWRYSGTVGDKAGEPSWANFMGGGIWESFDFWEHYQFSKDKEFLRKRAYPLIRGAVEFSLDWLTRNKDGKLVPPFTVSSEATYQDQSGYKGYCISNTGQDIALYGELFMNYMRICELLNRKDELYSRTKNAIASLVPYQIDPEGKIKEWLEPGVDRPYGGNTNHLSHLIGFYPGRHLIFQNDPKLTKAVKRTLEIFGPGQSGWMHAWEINLWARLRRPDDAFDLVKSLTDRVGPNDINPDGGYQVDWLLGYTAGICEMLVQSHKEDEDGNPIIELLPALPKDWRNGKVTGLRARGGFELDIEWKDGLMNKVVIKNVAPIDGKQAKVVVSVNGINKTFQISNKIEISDTSII